MPEPFRLTLAALTEIADQAGVQVREARAILDVFERSRRRVNRDAAIAARNFSLGAHVVASRAQDLAAALDDEQGHLTDDELANRE